MKKALKGITENIFDLYGFARCSFPYLLRNPMGYFFSITGRCNLSCDYCWQREKDDKKSENARSNKNELTPDEWFSVIKSVPRLSFVAFSGGEPLVYKHFKDILRFTSSRLRYSVNTNGLLLDEEILSIMNTSKAANLSISIDGFAETHDVSRKRSGLFDAIVDKINLLNSIKKKTGSKKPVLTIKTALQDSSLDTLPEFYRFCSEELEADCLTINFIKTLDHAQWDFRTYETLNDIANVGQPSCYNYQRRDEIPEVLGNLLDISRNNRCKVLLYPRVHNREEIIRFLKADGKGCYRRCFFPWSVVSVLADGTIIPCLSLNMGNIRDLGFDVKSIGALKKHHAFLSWRAGINKRNASPTQCNMCCFLKL